MLQILWKVYKEITPDMYELMLDVNILTLTVDQRIFLQTEWNLILWLEPIYLL